MTYYSNFSPKVSIVIPVYNGSNYMREAIDSAIAQTYQNIEIIVVNDGSNDDGKTREIALSYGDKIRYFEKENGGVSTALNLGIKEMKGEYFSWLSHDDVYYPNKIERQVECLLKYSKSFAIVYGEWNKIDEKSKLIHYVTFENHSEKDLFKPLYPLLNGLIYGCSLLIPKKYFLEIGLFKENLKTTQDYDLLFDFLRISPIIFCKDAIVKSRICNDQTSKIIGYFEEENYLWISFMKKISEKEILNLSATRLEFFININKFLSSTPYCDALKYSENIINSLLEKLKVSIVIPFFNRIEATINAIESVISQTHKNIEIILINDGSTEDILKITEIVNKNECIKYFSQINAGCSAARNLGIKNSSGEYIAFLDSDDQFYKNKIRSQLYQMAKGNYKVSYTSYDQANEDNAIKKIYCAELYKHKLNLFPDLISNCNLATPTIMIHRTILDTNKNLFNENMKNGGEDVCAWINLSSKYHFLGIEESLTIVNISQSSYSKNQKKQIIGILEILKFSILNFFNKSSEINFHIFVLYESIAKIINKNFIQENNKNSSNINFILFGIIPIFSLRKTAEKSSVIIFNKMTIFMKKILRNKTKFYLFGVLILKTKQE
jgi:glycosyltransferase involved in cell wall biosynthesis